jgi:hypothetical protein
MKGTTIFAFTFALLTARLCAQPLRSKRLKNDTVGFEETVQEVPATLQKIFSNLGPPKSAYYL